MVYGLTNSKSIVGIQAADVVKLAHLLLKKETLNDIYGVAGKEACPVLLHAAAFDSVFSRIALIEPYSSYRSIVMNRFYKPGFVHSFVPGALTAYDLPDLAASLAPRKLLLTGITDGNGTNTDNENISKDTDVVRLAYQQKKAGSQLHIVAKSVTKNAFDVYTDWIK